MRIMFVGDSMTIGRAGDFTWRYRMWQHFNATFGGPYRIVGPRAELYDPSVGEAASLDYGDPAFPTPARRHLAGWGEGWLQMAPLIRETVTAHRPELLLVSLGLIDLGFYTNAEQTTQNVRRFVQEARAADPGIAIAMLPVIPNVRAAGDAAFAEECAEFTVRQAKAVAGLDGGASPLLLASVPDGWNLDRDTYDGTHPSPTGEHRIAAAFADALYQAWDIGAPYRLPDSCSPVRP
ncbi:GDSL-type esterase/lipase family protein [Streptomyces sp. H27-D2]|uniref:GDSL-type esterase/lipase family protein n=1 Tax=Streptomyces sp. H27-D2 TaxID=3046304 RepID=UPI002DBDDE72|nr:GDSL-type esterase/lipase family protein [Streptomyces sp. H27-D2]MEC4016834.1 GDSL-type esterase/lipase family protein [Streptomyces sp. H27-D2]